MVQNRLDFCEKCENGMYYNALLKECIALEEIILHCTEYSLYNPSICLTCDKNYYLIDGSCESLSIIDNCNSYDTYNNCLGKNFFYFLLYQMSLKNKNKQILLNSFFNLKNNNIFPFKLLIQIIIIWIFKHLFIFPKIS